MRDKFILPEKTIYMCGHSLGPMPKSAALAADICLKNWSEEVVGGWNKADWIHLPYKIGALIAPLIGADPNEVIVTDSTSINLFKVLYNACKLNSKRHIIMTEDDNFPADLYIVQGIQSLNKTVQIQYVRSDQILEQLTENVVVLMLTHINYRTSLIHDMKAITARAHELGVIVVWDLAHSVGAVPLTLNAHDVDFAVGCTYKYLNGGPGSPSCIYVNKRHHKNISNPIYGWMGHKAPFSFSNNFTPAEGLGAYLGGTPSILSMKALEGALELFDGLSMQTLRTSSMENTNRLIGILGTTVPELVCVSPKLPEIRGCHVAFKHDKAYALSRALINAGVICDYREPNLIRLSVSPLYLDHADIEKASVIIEKVIRTRSYEDPQFQKLLRVT